MTRFTIFAILLIAGGAGAQESFDCNASPPHRAFDFWLGEWEVRDESGELQGHNHIRKVQAGCALEEQWTSVSGGTGQSLNYYDPDSGGWRQLWLDAGASIIDIQGGPTARGMLLEGTIHYLHDNGRFPFRGLWTPLPDGRVRQFFEQRNREGEWQPWFEGFYSRTEKTGG
jgi:hypothetical protein